MHDLKESGQFEQDADMIFLLFRPGPKDTDFDPDTNRFLKIAKNKEARKGKWPLYFEGNRQTFSVMVDDSGKALMRALVNEGKRAKTRNQKEAQKRAEEQAKKKAEEQARKDAEIRQMKVTELPPNDSGLPF